MVSIINWRSLDSNCISVHRIMVSFVKSLKWKSWYQSVKAKKIVWLWELYDRLILLDLKIPHHSS